MSFQSKYEAKMSPEVRIDVENQIIALSGASYPEDPLEVFNPIYKWVVDFSMNMEKKLCFILNFEFLNSSSHKMLYEIFVKAQEFSKKGKPVEILWYYDPEDEEIFEMGQDFMEVLELPIQLIPKE